MHIKRMSGGRERVRFSYLQSQRLPSHVLEQRRGGGECALRAFLQSQGDACRVPTQQIHQILQLPAHLVDKNSSDERVWSFFFSPSPSFPLQCAGIPVTHTAQTIEWYSNTQTRSTQWLNPGIWGEFVCFFVFFYSFQVLFGWFIFAALNGHAIRRCDPGCYFN